LEIIDGKPDMANGMGFKVFAKRDDGELIPALFGKDKICPMNIWLNEKKYRAIKNVQPFGYGWYIFLNLDSAKDWLLRPCEVIRKVLYRKAFISGRLSKWSHEDEKVVIAKEILILSDSRE